MSIKLNVNIRTLLNNCEEISKHEANYKRLEPLIDCLQSMIEELQEADSTCKYLSSYEARLERLKEQIGYTGESKLEATQTNESCNMEKSQDLLRQSRQLRSSRIYMDLRRKLLPETRHGQHVDDSDEVETKATGILRYRHTAHPTEALNSPRTNETVLPPYLLGKTSSSMPHGYKNLNCDVITDHMMSLTRSLREQTEIANRIIRSDTDTVSKSNDTVDDNLHTLNTKSRLLLNYSSLDRKCWMWLMITFILITFIGMVLFMKMVKKK